MSRIDELKKQHPNYALSAIDVYKMISPNQSNKYVEMLIKLDKTDYHYSGDDHRARLIEEMTNSWGLDYNYLETLELETLIFLVNSINILMQGKIKSFTKFASYNERKLIENNDVTSYSSWEEIENAVALADVKQLDKKLEKQIKKIYEDDTWLSLRPLSLEASMKYGANTKWCTTTESGQYYARYASRGILIYNINKKTGYKVACFKNLSPEHDNEFSWWDVTDKKIEALDSEAPVAVLEAIRNEIKTHPYYNSHLMSDEEQAKLNQYKNGYGPAVDDGTRLHISGGLVSSGGIVGTVSTHGTTSIYNPITFTTTSTVGMGTATPNAQINVHGNIEVNDGDIVFRTNGEERARLTSNGFEGIGLTEPPNEQPTLLDRNYYNEIIREVSEGENFDLQRLEEVMAEQLAEANERVAEKHLSLLDNIELGTVQAELVNRMQQLAGIETRESRLAKLDAEVARLRNEPIPEVVDDTYDYTKDIQSSLYEPEVAEQPVVHSKPKQSIWNQIKSRFK